MVEMMAQEKHGFHVKFELRKKEIRDDEGHVSLVDDEMALITYIGGNGNGVDKVVTPSLLNEWKFGDGQRKLPCPFAITAYEAWKEGREPPVNGTDLKNWPGVTPAQLETCQRARIKAVEELAEANADTISKLGMGGVALVEKAKAYLAAAGDIKYAEEVAALTVKMEAMAATIAKKDDQIAELMDKLTTPDEAPKPRKKKAA